MVCTWEGEEVPCRTEWGWYSNGCYYQQVEGSAGTRDGQPGAVYLPRCLSDPENVQRRTVWIADSQAPGVAELSRLAVSRLVLPPPAIALSPPPPAAQLVNLPTWLWIDSQWWDERTASASVPGVTVTAVGAPVSARWDTGDGAVVTCEGPGTAYQPGGDPEAASPDCGHTYTRSSAGAPGGVFTVTVTVTWEVSWSGGGLSGTEDPLFSTATVDVPVAEAQTVIVP